MQDIEQASLYIRACLHVGGKYAIIIVEVRLDTHNWLRAGTMSDDPELDALLAGLDSPPREKVSYPLVVASYYGELR